MTKTFDFIATDWRLEYTEENGGVVDFIASPPLLFEPNPNEVEIPQIRQTNYYNEGSLSKSVMRSLEIVLEGEVDLQGEWLEYKRTFEVDGDDFTINYGMFRVIEQEYNVGEDSTKLKLFDLMVRTHKEVHKDEFNLKFPTTLGNIFHKVASICELDTDVKTFDGSDLVVERDEWTNTKYTYRDILDHIASITGTVVGIKGDKLDIWKYNDTGITVSGEGSKSIQVGEKVGPFNILNVTEEPQHYNVPYPEDWKNIPIDERSEYVLENNPIANFDRDKFSPYVFEQVKDLEYTTFEADTFGWGIFHVGDVVTVKDLNGKEHKSIITGESGTFDQAFHSKVKSEKIENAKDEYVVATDQARAGQRVYLIVDQQEGKIQGLVERANEQEDRVTDLSLTVEGLSAKVGSLNSNANIIPNLNGNLENYMLWTFENTKNTPFIDGMIFREYMPFNTNFEIKTFPMTLSQWGLSFFGSGKAITGRGYVVPDDIYSFRGKRVNGLQSFSVTVMQYDKDDKFLREREVTFNEPKAYEAFSIKMPEDTQYVRLAFNIPDTVNLNNRLILADMMFNRGNPKEWQESAGDVKLFAEANFEVLDNSITSTIDELKIVDGKTVENESKLEQLSNKFVLSAKSDGSLALVELGADPETGSSFVVKAHDISLEGLTTINGGFKVLENGNVEMVNAFVEGEIVANKGVIGNLKLENGALVYTTGWINKEWEYSDLARVRSIILGLIKPSAYDKEVYDVNKDGNITLIDLAMIQSHLTGKNPLPPTKIKREVAVGTTKAEVSTYAISQSGHKGEETVMSGDNITTSRMDADALSTTQIFLNEKEVTVDHEGYLKIVK